MSQEQKNILKLDEEVLKHAAPIKHNWSMNDTSKDYGKATSSSYGHVVIDSNLNTSSPNPVSNQTITTAINQLNNEKATKNHASNTTDFGVATSSLYGHVKVDTELKNSDNPVKNSIIKAKFDTLDTSINNITTALGTNAEDVKKLLNLNTPTSLSTDIDALTEPGFYIYHSETEKAISKNTYYNEALIFVLKNDTRIIQHIYPTKKIYKENSDEFKYRLNGSQYTRFGISTENSIDWSMLSVSYKPYTETTLVKEIKAEDASVKVFENTAGYQIEWEQLNTKQEYEIVANELYAYETICLFDDLSIKGPFIFGNLIGKCDVRITPEKMEIRSTLNQGNIIKNIHQTFFVPRI